MNAFRHDPHARHQGKPEMFRGALVPCCEVPARVDRVLAELRARRLGPVQAPSAGRDEAIARPCPPPPGVPGRSMGRVGGAAVRSGTRCRAATGLPAAFVFEGGYALNVLDGFRQRAG